MMMLDIKNIIKCGHRSICAEFSLYVELKVGDLSRWGGREGGGV